MRTLVSLLMLCAAGCAGGAYRLVPSGATVERVATGFRFTEGPACDPAGNICFTDPPRSIIARFDVASGEVTVIREDSGGANGLMFDGAGRLWVCEGARRRVTRISDGLTERIASEFDGGRLNQPNDLVLDGAGGCYFTDPLYDRRRSREQDVEGVYHVDAAGTIRRVVDDLRRPNGLILSGDGKRLYVADDAAKQIMVYDVAGGGSLTAGRVFAEMDSGPDGMTVDDHGHVYAAGRDAIWVWDARGRLEAKIAVPENPANCTFGGPRREHLYITARTSLYRIALNARGL